MQFSVDMDARKRLGKFSKEPTMKRFTLFLAVLLVMAAPSFAASPTTPWAGQLFNSDIYSNLQGNQSFFAGIAMNTDADTIYVYNWQSYGGNPGRSTAGFVADGVVSGTDGDDAYNVDYYLYDITTGIYKDITDWDASAGMIVTATFSPTVTAGNYVAIVWKPILDTWIALADGSGEIDTTLENSRAGVAIIQAAVDTEVGAIRDSLEDANDILQAVYGSAATFSKWQFIPATINLVAADSVWNTVATNEVFDVTGAMKEAYLVVYDSIAIGGADSIAIQIGTTVVSKVLKSEWDANEYITYPADFTAYRAVDPSTAAGLGVILDESTAATHILHFHNLQGLDIGYVIGTATPIDTGTIRFKLWYIMEPGGSVSLGAGGTL
jgi:hypothetical protein